MTTPEELLPRAVWLLHFAARHPVEIELYEFVYGRRDTERLTRLSDGRPLDVGEVDAVLHNFEKRLPQIVNARWN